MLIIGHRGAMGYEPENTLRSFKKALSLSVKMVELDVYACKSGELVVFHDDTLERTTNGTGYVQEQTLSQLKILNAGKKEHIPTLHEVLDLIDHRCNVNIELKGERTAIPVSRILKEYCKNGWAVNDFLVSSFNHHELRHFKKLLPTVQIGALISGIPLTYAQFAEELGATSVNLDSDFVTKAFVDDAHKRDLLVYVFTVNRVEHYIRLKRIGVDGIFTNFPDRFK